MTFVSSPFPSDILQLRDIQIVVFEQPTPRDGKRVMFNAKRVAETIINDLTLIFLFLRENILWRPLTCTAVRNILKMLQGKQINFTTHDCAVV